MSGGAWYYYAPSKKLNKEPQPAPPPSQIPGLNGELNGEDEKRPQMMIKDTDSKYIQLAKQGGRQNLLMIEEKDTRSKDPVPYPRVDWFYQDDIRMEEQENQKSQDKEHYEPMLPEYMVHEEYAQEENDDYAPPRLPYGYDRSTVYEREGQRATDKTIKIPEAKKAGISQRLSKPVKQPQPVVNQRHGPVKQRADAKSKHQVMKLPDNKDRDCMSKILSYGYQQEWLEQRSSHFDKMKTYQQTEKPLKGNEHRQMEEDKERELFKLSKFKNVSSKVSHKRDGAKLPPLERPTSNKQNDALRLERPGDYIAVSGN